MNDLTLTGLVGSGQVVSSAMFGANLVFAQSDLGVPTDAYVEVAEVFGVQNVRFAGGQGDLDPNRPLDNGRLPVEGQDWINTVQLQNGGLRTELIDFFEWCLAQQAETGAQIKTTLVIPTKFLNVADYEGFAHDITQFVTLVMQQYGYLIEAFEIGNEHWEMGETAYGQKASIAAEAIAAGLAAAGIAEANQPSILVQMATAGNTGSQFQPTPGVNDFRARNEAANQEIIDQLSGEARDAIDGVVEHYFFNKHYQTFTGNTNETNYIRQDIAVWDAAFDKELDVHITEWNVRTSTSTQHGMVAGSTFLEQFELMVGMGVDAAHVWAFDYHSRTALTLEADGGAQLDEAGRLTNSIQGALFDLMAENLVGKQLLDATFTNASGAIEINSYGNAGELVFYVSSRSLDVEEIELDLSAFAPGAHSVSAIQIHMDQSTSNGWQWQNGPAAESVTIDGQAYYYNEHDVDVFYSDLSFASAADIDLVLKPFEVVQIIVDLVPVAANSSRNAWGDEDDVIQFADELTIIDGGDGRDTAVFSNPQSQYTLTFGPQITTFITNRASQSQETETLLNIEILDFDPEIPVLNGQPLQFDTIDDAANLDGATFTQIAELYIAYFNRAPDALGLYYWADQFASGFTLPQMAASFFVQPETQATYTDLLDDDGKLVDVEGFVTAVYENVPGRAPDAEGFSYWVNELNNNPAITPDTFILALINGAKNPSKPTAQTAIDKQYIEQKAQLGIYYSTILGLSDVEDAKDLSLFDGSDASIDLTRSAFDEHFSDALDTNTGDFVISLVGVVDNPFAIA